MSTPSLPEHLRKPHVRPIQPMPVQKDGKQFIALRDPAMLSQQTMVVPMQVLQVLQQFRGERTLDELAQQFQGNIDQFTELARGLDRVGLLWGPTFEQMESDRWDSLRQAGVFPVRHSRMLGESEAACRATIESYFNQTDDPELEADAIGLIAPHLDYQRGWPNYAAAYYGARALDAPDRVVVLGTNHFGLGDGVIITELGFESPLGTCPADSSVIEKLVDQFGKAITADQLDLASEHSIELQIPWIQYCFGNVPVVAALVPDPLAQMIADDGERVAGDVFVGALRETLDAVGGRTFFIASSDLSHVGPQFGEPRPVDDQRRVDVERHDRDMMGKYLAGDPEEFLGAMRWNKNPTRWCSIGNMTALLMLTEPEEIELIDYRQACDERGIALVSSAAMVLS